MIFTFLGTGTSQGIPMIGCHCEVCRSIDYRDQRTRTSGHFQMDDLSFVIDSGPDFRQQILRERITKLDAVLFTHEHKDHTAGLDDVRAFNFIQNKAMQVYARPSVLKHLQQEFAYAFQDFKYPGVPLIDLNALDGNVFTIGGVDIIPINVMHYKLPVYGFRIGDLCYITDANYISEAEQEKIKGSKIIIINGLQKEFHISHYTLQEVLDLIKIWKPEKAYLTHMSHRLGKHQDVQKELPDNVFLAYDGLQIHLPH